jgi:NAD(P)-dependent dehydrogenase (short-subunit alcohol dehydrogenase family)
MVKAKSSIHPARAAIVTGAARGIGLGIAEGLLADGYGVLVVDVDKQALAGAREAFAGQMQAVFLQSDVSTEAGVRKMVAAAKRRFGGIDLLVCNAALADPVNGPIESLKLADWERRLRINLTSVFLAAKHAAPLLRRRRGAIVNMSSTRALMSEPNTEAYAASKGGIDALTHALAVSLGPEVRVNAIRPGWVATHGTPRSRKAHSQHPVGRVGTPADVAALVRYLGSDAAGFVTGQCFTIDGGMTRKMIYEG